MLPIWVSIGLPVLEHDGRRLSQSGVILDYLAESLGMFGPRDADERLGAEVKKKLSQLEGLAGP